MRWNDHSKLVGAHAFLSPSKYSWINYDMQKLDARYIASMAARKGTELHEFAHDAVRLGIRLPDTEQTLNKYVNDAIGYRMTPDQVLFYSENAFGTADTIAFRRNMLRVHDLKTGITATSVHQLEVYAALFCLEYEMKPFSIDIELRIYQNDEVRVYPGDADLITHIMDQIITFDKRIREIRAEVDM